MSARHGHAGVLLAAVTFALGLGISASIGPVTANRSEAPAPVPARSSETATIRIVHPAEVVRVVDGDTFEARVHLWPGLDLSTRVRLRGIDAPELKASCPQELQMAEAASEALRGLLGEGEVTIFNIGPDKYSGRVVADVATRKTANVSASLLAAGHARSYNGGHRAGWCANLTR